VLGEMIATRVDLSKSGALLSGLREGLLPALELSGTSKYSNGAQFSGLIVEEVELVDDADDSLEAACATPGPMFGTPALAARPTLWYS